MNVLPVINSLLGIYDPNHLVRPVVSLSKKVLDDPSKELIVVKRRYGLKIKWSTCTSTRTDSPLGLPDVPYTVLRYVHMSTSDLQVNSVLIIICKNW